MPVGYVPRIPQIRRYLRAIDPDLVHGQGTEDGYGWLAVHSGLRHIVTVHGLLASINREDELPIFHPRRVGAWTERSTLRQADAVIAIAGFVKEQLRRYDVSFYEIPNAVSSNFYELTHQPPDTPTLLCVGRLTPAKGILDLIRALKLLDDRKIRCDVKVIGASGGETIAYETECKKAAEQLTHVRVTFSGHVQRTALANEYRHATALVMTSHAETLPMVIAEAMATGLPAVAYDVGGIGDQIDDDINGYLIPRGDVERLASRLENIIVDEGLADRFGSAARDKAKGWHEGRVADETVRAYADIVGRSATGNR
jgi:glycosyltransferase involved in cell wall biosynthesis